MSPYPSYAPEGPGTKFAPHPSMLQGPRTGALQKAPREGYEHMPLSGPLPDLRSTLAERGKRYGAFDSHAAITQGLKAVMHGAPKWRELAPDQKECLEMIAHKIGRALNGDVNYADNFTDIAGYAQLVADRLTSVPHSS